MATLKGGKITSIIKSASIRMVSFSGTVKLSGTGVVRSLKGYKVSFPEVVFETVSDSSGNFVLPIGGGSNDFFRIIVIGVDGENSEVFEGLAG